MSFKIPKELTPKGMLKSLDDFLANMGNELQPHEIYEFTQSFTDVMEEETDELLGFTKKTLDVDFDAEISLNLTLKTGRVHLPMVTYRAGHSQFGPMLWYSHPLVRKLILDAIHQKKIELGRESETFRIEGDEYSQNPKLKEFSV